MMGLRWNLGLSLRLGPRSDSKFEFRFGVSIGGWVRVGVKSRMGSRFRFEDKV